jgi:hypothetical protein
MHIVSDWSWWIEVEHHPSWIFRITEILPEARTCEPYTIKIVLYALYLQICMLKWGPYYVDCICRISFHSFFPYRFNNVSGGVLHAVEWGLQVYWESAEVLFWVCASLCDYLCIHTFLISCPLKQPVQAEEILL